MKKIEYINALREMADFLEDRKFPDDKNYGECYLYLRAETKEEFGNLCSALGTFNKESTYSTLDAKKILPSGNKILIFADKEDTCEKVVVGKKKVPFKEAELLPAVPEHEEDIVEWKCPESFVALKGE